MTMPLHAILAVLLVGTSANPPAATPPPGEGDGPPPAPIAADPPASSPDDESVHAFVPRRVRFRLADGVRVTGELTGWDDEGVDGSFARRLWTEIHHEDVWRLYRGLMDRERPQSWVDLGRTMLLVALDQPDAADRAEKAFRRAVALARDDPAAIEEAIGHARAEIEDEARMRERIRQAIEAERLRTLPPEAQSWTPQPWPALTDEEQAEATATMRADAVDILERAGLRLEPVETEHFLFYSDMTRREAARWTSELDAMYRRLAEQFALPANENIFWGKAVIFVFNQRDRFRLVEAEAFGQLAPAWADGFCHPIGPKVFVNFYRRRSTEDFAAVLVHETSHGFMHRYRTPYRLPTWANEGFADYLASVLFRNSPVDRARRSEGVHFVRGGGDVNALLDASYLNGAWPGPGEVGYCVGYLMIELMIRDRPGAFRAWVDAIKTGKPWEKALEEDFGVTRAKLVDTFVRYYRVND